MIFFFVSLKCVDTQDMPKGLAADGKRKETDSKGMTWVCEKENIKAEKQTCDCARKKEKGAIKT